MKRIATVLACSSLLSLPFTANASGTVLAESTFAAGAEGWTALGTNGTSDWAITSGPFAVNFAAGEITMTDPNNDWTYFRAPAAFLGDKGAAFGGQLQFESRVVSAPGGTLANEAEVVLKGAGMTLVYDAVPGLSTDTTYFNIGLGSGGWRVSDTYSGVFATDAQLQAVLGNLSELWINAEYYTPVVETIALDNVRLVAAVPEPETYAMLLAGLALVGGAARRRF